MSQQDLQALKKVAVGMSGALVLFAAGVSGVVAQGDSREEVLERIRPVGYAEPTAAAQPAAAPVTAAEPAAAAPSAAAAAPSAAAAEPESAAAPAAIDGNAVYMSACFACHGTGAAGAPKMGDKAAWAGRIAQGKDTLLAHAVSGFKGSVGVMPPKGGSMHLSDDEVSAAVDHMVSQSQ